MSYVPANKQANAPIPPSTLMSYFDNSRNSTPNAAAAAASRNAPAAAPTQLGVCAHDTNVPFPKPEQPQPAAQARSRSDSIASSYKQYFAQKAPQQLTHSEASISRSASMVSSRGAPAYVETAEPSHVQQQQQQRAAPYPHEPSKPARESATARQAAAPRAAAPAPAHAAYPTESEDWDRAEEPVMREESPLDTQAVTASEETTTPAPPRNASNQNAATAAPVAARRSPPPPAQTQPQPARPAYATSEDDGHRTPYTPREVPGASASRTEGTPIRRAAPANTATAAPAPAGMHDVVMPEHSNSYMEPGTPRSDRGTPRRKSDARRLNPHSNSYDPVYASYTPRSDDDEVERDDYPNSSRPPYPAYESLGAARAAPTQPQAQARQQPPSQQTYPSQYQPRSTAVAAPVAGGAEDPRQQYPSQYRSLYRPEVRPKRDDAAAAPSFPFNRSESSVVADSTTTSERGYRPRFDLSPRRAEDYVADDMQLDDDDANCTFQPNLDRRQSPTRKPRASSDGEGEDGETPVFSRLYADAQRFNRVREEREQALELQRQMRRGEVPFDAQALRAAGIPVNEIDETELAVGASRRATLRLADEEPKEDGDEQAGDEEGSQADAADKEKRRRSSMGRKKVDFEVFERLSKPQVITPKFQRAQEMKQQAEKDEVHRREEAKRDALENIGHYDWGLPAKSFTMADLRQQNTVFAK